MSSWIDFKLVKLAADFPAILERYGIVLERRGAELVGRCPFHEDHKPSFRVNVEKKVFHCFGCHAKGGAIEFVAKKDGISIKEAAEKLGEWFNIPQTEKSVPKRGKAAKDATPATNEEPKSTPAKPEELKPLAFSLALDSEHAYLKERGLSAETIAAFGLGFCSRGILKGRIAIPIHDAKGQLVGYAGRWPGDPPEGEERYRLPSGFPKSQVLFNLHRVKDDEHLVVVEGFFSVFRLHALGIAAVALMGSTASAAQIALLEASAAKRLTLLMDGDAAGHAAAASLLPQLARRFFVRVAELADGAQPDTVGDDELRRILATS